MSNLHSTSGFTLIEVMVVMVIIGIAAAAVSVSMTPNAADQLNRDARDLALRLTTAQNEVHLDGRVIAWQALGNGYQFVRGTWTTTHGSIIPIVTTAGDLDRFTDDESLRPRQWRADRVDISPQQPLLLTSEWVGPPLRLELRSGEHNVTIMRDGSGSYRVQ